MPGVVIGVTGKLEKHELVAFDTLLVVKYLKASGTGTRGVTEENIDAVDITEVHLKEFVNSQQIVTREHELCEVIVGELKPVANGITEVMSSKNMGAESDDLVKVGSVKCRGSAGSGIDATKGNDVATTQTHEKRHSADAIACKGTNEGTASRVLPHDDSENVPQGSIKRIR